jgi:transposase
VTEFKRRRGKPLRFIRVPLAQDHPDWLDLDRELPPDHLARRIRFLVESLDLSPLFETYSGVGAAAAPPDLLLQLVLFEIHRQHLSPTRWFTDSRESLPARWLLRGLRPSRSTFYRFRAHLPPLLLDSLNHQVLLLAQVESHTTAENAALDGTFTAAYGSRHRLLTATGLAQRLQLLELAVAADQASVPSGWAEPPPAPLAQPGPVTPPPASASPPGGPPVVARPYWLAGSAAGRLRQRQRYLLAQQTLQGRLVDHDSKQKRLRKARRRSAQKVVICPTEPEAALGRDKFKVFRPLYNTQIAQDLDSPFVLGYGLYAKATDSGLLPPMIERTQQLTGRKLKKVLVDGVYAGLKDVTYCKENGVELYAPVEPEGKKGKEAGQGGNSQGSKGKKKARKMGKEQFDWQEKEQTYRCPAGHLLQLGRIRERERESGETEQLREYRCDKEHCQKCPQAGQCTSRPDKGRTIERRQGQEVLDEVAARMRTEQGKKEYKKRKQTVEPRHGDMRTHRGLTHFHGHGLEQGHSQVGLLVLANNGLALLKAREQRKSQAAAPPAEVPQVNKPLGHDTRQPTAKPPPSPRHYSLNCEWLCYN